MAASLERAFEVIVAIELAKIFRGFGPLPAVVATRDQTAPWNRVGASRTVELSDESSAHEQLTAYIAPQQFSYQLNAFTGTLRLLVFSIDGLWWFSRAGTGTHIRWSYIFHPRAGRAWAVRILAAPLWKLYQRRALARAGHEAEAGSGHRQPRAARQPEGRDASQAGRARHRVSRLRATAAGRACAVAPELEECARSWDADRELGQEEPPRDR